MRFNSRWGDSCIRATRAAVSKRRLGLLALGLGLTMAAAMLTGIGSDTSASSSVANEKWGRNTASEQSGQTIQLARATNERWG